MIGIVAQLIGQAIRWAIYLALVGEITFCTLDLRQKAGKSVQTGLINLGNLNRQLHKQK